MNLRHKWRSRSWAFSIKTCVQSEIEDAEGGVAEQADQKARQAAAYLGELTELLHEKGLLSDEDILRLLPSYELNVR